LSPVPGTPQVTGSESVTVPADSVHGCEFGGCPVGSDDTGVNLESFERPGRNDGIHGSFTRELPRQAIFFQYLLCR